MNERDLLAEADARALRYLEGNNTRRVFLMRTLSPRLARLMNRCLRQENPLKGRWRYWMISVRLRPQHQTGRGILASSWGRHCLPLLRLSGLWSHGINVRHRF